MNVENFAEWLRLQNYSVSRTASSYWFNTAPGVYQAFPYHWLIKPTSGEISELLLQNRALGLRYSSPIQDSTGLVSYHAVLEEADYGFNTLGKSARKNVRRGLNHCRVEPISFDRLAEEGWSLQIDTLTRQGRTQRITPGAWRALCSGASGLPGFIAWGALVGNQLAASVITFQMDDWAYMLYQQCSHNYLAEHVNNALAFIVTTELLQQFKIKSILYGLHSLDAPPSVDEFKFRMGYIAKPVRQHVVFNPGISPLFNSLTHGLLKGALHIFPGNPTFSKAEGMVRFYLEGKKPLDEQVWPDILIQKRDLIKSDLS